MTLADGIPRETTCPDAFLDLAERLADRARGIARRHFRQPVAVETKPDRSPVTVADRDTEAALRALIAETFPEHGIVGEEEAARAPDAEHVWVLDPIDGTKRFIAGNPLFGSLIGLLEGGRPILGVIEMPALGERWIGAAGHPSRRVTAEGSGAARCRACPDLDRATLAATSPDMFEGGDRAAFGRLRDASRHALYGGDCFNYATLADGFVDLVVEADMGTHDYLPLVGVVENAGGKITDWAGRPLGLGSDGRVLAAGDPALHAKAMAVLRGH